MWKQFLPFLKKKTEADLNSPEIRVEGEHIFCSAWEAKVLGRLGKRSAGFLVGVKLIIF